MSWFNFLVNSQKPRSNETAGLLLLLFEGVGNKELFGLMILNRGGFDGWFGGICCLVSCENVFCPTGREIGFYDIGKDCYGIRDLILVVGLVLEISLLDSCMEW